jgi:hypothetical protein
MTVKNYTANSKIPKGKDFKTTSDGIMVADHGFRKQLWALDPELDVVWDWGSARWEIWRFPGQANKKNKIIDSRACYLIRVQTKNRTFRELGADILLQLQKGDPTRFSLKELVNYFDKMDDNIQRAKRKTFMNYLESVKLETDRWVRGVPFVQVPKKLKVNDKDNKYLLNVNPGEQKQRYQIFKPSNTFKMARALGGIND